MDSPLASVYVKFLLPDKTRILTVLVLFCFCLIIRSAQTHNCPCFGLLRADRHFLRFVGLALVSRRYFSQLCILVATSFEEKLRDLGVGHGHRLLVPCVTCSRMVHRL